MSRVLIEDWNSLSYTYLKPTHFLSFPRHTIQGFPRRQWPIAIILLLSSPHALAIITEECNKPYSSVMPTKFIWMQGGLIEKTLWIDDENVWSIIQCYSLGLVIYNDDKKIPCLHYHIFLHNDKDDIHVCGNWPLLCWQVAQTASKYNGSPVAKQGDMVVPWPLKMPWNGILSLSGKSTIGILHNWCCHDTYSSNANVANLWDRKCH